MSRAGQVSIRHSLTSNLKGLVRFSGRQTRAQFWPYALIAFGAGLVVAMLGFLGPMLEAMAKMQEYALAHPGQATISSGPGHYSVTVHGDAPRFFDAREGLLAMAPGAALMVVSLAAAVTRRLHDTGLTGLLGLTPIVLAVPAVRATIAQFDGPIGEGIRSGQFQQGFVLTALYNLSILALIVLLCRSGTLGANHYGPPPNSSS